MMLLRLKRSAQVSGAWLAFLASVALLLVLIGLLVWNPRSRDRRPLFVYCAAGLKAPVEQIASDYEEEYGVQIQLTYGGSETLLANLAVSKRGDLYIPADESYIASARSRGLVEEDIPLAHMTAVLAVRKGNPKGVRSLKELIERQDIRFGQAEPDAAAIGMVTRKELAKTGRWEALLRRTSVKKMTVTDIANDVQVGTVGALDAGIVWDATVRQYPGLEMIKLPELKNARSNISVAVLGSCNRPASALHFARYLSARDKGLPVFKDKGYEPVDGDAWAGGEPELTLYAGAMLRPAIEETLDAFAEREGIPRENIHCVYNGCGILVSQMQKGPRPDAYFACDARFLEQVKDLFLDDVTVSTNQLVLFVHKGNPKNIRSLRDLKRPGLRVGIGNEHQCAMGLLTQETLRQAGVKEDVKKNVVVESATGDILINQMLAAPSSLDAVVAYVSNGKRAADRLDEIPIDLPCAVAAQPIAVGRQSDCKHLAGRLRRMILSNPSRARFEENGFKWKAPSR
jgi:molybdenum ABC transporter molybdate-binding protein